MNIRRGFFRLWLVASAFWVIAVIATFSGYTIWNNIADGWKAQREEAAIEPVNNFRFIPGEIIERIDRGREAETQAQWLGKFAIIPPLVLLSIGAAVGWAFSGFG